MAFPISPGVVVNEIDDTTYVPGVATAVGALAGVFRWGPVGEKLSVDSEGTYATRLGKPTNFNAETWFTGASFLAYANNAQFVRAANTVGTSPIVVANVTSANALINVGNTSSLANGMIVVAVDDPTKLRVGAIINVVNGSHVQTSASSDALGTGNAISVQFITGATVLNAIGNTAAVANLTNQIVKSEAHFTSKFENSDFDSDIIFLAKWPGAIGNSLKVSLVDTVNAYSSNTDLTSNGTYVANVAFTVDSNTAVISIGANGSPLNVNTLNSFVQSVYESLTVGDQIVAGNVDIGEQLITTKTITKGANVGLAANSGTTANVTSGSANVSTTGGAFSAVLPGAHIAIYSNSSTYSTYIVNAVPTSNSLTLTTNASFTNATAVFALLDATVGTISLSLEDKYKRSQDSSLTTLSRFWQYAATFDTPPGQSSQVLEAGNTAANDEVHLVVVDEDGKFSGVPGTILERWEGLSRSTEGKTLDGETNYYKTVINDGSQYIWSIYDRPGSASANSLNIASSTNESPLSMSLNYGADGHDESNVSMGVLSNAYDAFLADEPFMSDVSLVMQGKARGGVHGGQLANYLIDNLAEARQDLVVFVSPEKADVVNNVGFEAQDIVAFRNSLRSSSYGFLDSGYKYMYDRYNDVYRYVPLNGDMAGLAARTEQTNDAWWSFAGLNRGKIKNVVKLAYNPRKAERDILYKNSINPVVTFPGDGTLLYGDKTLLAKPSAFDRINVRRLFIILEKAISKAAKYSLFEFNDAFTRAQFRNLVIPFLRDVMGRRGIVDFLVVCDGTNNPASVIERNEFVGDIYIKANRSINFITLNFHNTPLGASFTEVISQ